MKWSYSVNNKKIVGILSERNLWGERVIQVFIPQENRITDDVRGENLIPIEEKPLLSGKHIIYTSCAGRISDELEMGLTVSPLGGSLIPLPHQIDALSRILSGDRIRYLLADEVGLGKTIEAGMVFRELKIRGMVKRVLVVAPKGLTYQWISEMKNHFGEDFHLFEPGGNNNYGINHLEMWDQVICSLDSVKPIEKRRGWNQEQIDRHNQKRFDSIIQAGWDLVIIDEAHRVAGASDTVARHTLARGLADSSPYFLLLSATPHSGKSDAFRRLMSLLDEETFIDEDSLKKEKVSPYVIRTEKRNAVNFKGEKLFQPRKTRIHYIKWDESHQLQKKLYESVTDYVRNGYNRAIQEKNFAVGFLMVLLQRLVTSSTRAIRSTLEKRKGILERRGDDLDARKEEIIRELSDSGFTDETDLLQMYALLKEEHIIETDEVESIIRLAGECEKAGNDSKTESLMELIYEISSQEVNPDLKFLIFTEFIATQEMLKEYMTDRGFSVAIINGGMSIEERTQSQIDFSGKTRIMISTDAGGEGLNLQFCHVVINYDVPWTPTKIEQRIGRVDRIGQKHTVKAINFLLEDSVEKRIFEVLEEKLYKIFEQLGIDKTSDILDSEESEETFRQFYINSIMNPGSITGNAEKITQELLRRAEESKKQWKHLFASYEITPEKAQNLFSHPLSNWIETMVINYIPDKGGKVQKKLRGYDLIWEDGEKMTNITFNRDETEEGITTHLSLENPRVMNLIKNLPLFVQGEKIPSIAVKGLPSSVKGYWSLWKIAVKNNETTKHRIFPLFRQKDGRIFKPTAQRLWDILISETTNIKIKEPVTGRECSAIYGEMEETAIKYGEDMFQEIKNGFNLFLKKEREKGLYAFESRKKAIERIGLPEVRNFRLKQLEKEKKEWETKIKSMDSIIPEISCLLICHVTAYENN